MSEMLSLLPLKLKAVRHAKGMSQDTLAIRSHVHVKTISSFETGKRIDSMKLAQLINIAHALEVTVMELLTPPEAEVAPVIRESRTVPAPTFRRKPVTLLPFSDFHRSSLGEGWR